MRFPTRGPTKRKRNWPSSSASACCACAPELQHKTISSAKQAFPLRSSATRTSIRKEYGNKWCRWRESEFSPPLIPRNLLILQDGRNYKNIEFTQVRYTAV